MNIRQKLILYAITDARPAAELPGAVALACQGGATMVQLRAKGLQDDELRALARQILAVTDQYGVPLIINDRADIAREIGAAGAHLGLNDGNLRAARALLGPNLILGATARSLEQALAAQTAGADYLGCGAVFGTSTKLDATAMPLAVLREICAAVNIPVVAIGGIDRTNIAKLRGSGIAGCAVISGIFGCDDIKGAAQELRMQK